MTTAANQDFKTLFEKYCTQTIQIKEGEVLKGKVAAINRDLVLVDVGFKSEGQVALSEFIDLDGKPKVAVGDEVDVMVEEVEDEKGHIILSKERADALRSWDRVAQVYETDGIIDGVIVNKIKGGMSVNLGGIKAFLPGSQIDLKPVKSLDKLVGQKFSFKILKLNKLKGNIVLSRRTILEVERETQKKGLLENLKEGQIIKGCVKNITDYGAFVDLGGVDGLLHITDVTWGRINHPSEILKLGDEIDVAVLKFEAGCEKLSLGLKQLKPDPWDEVDQKFIVGEKVSGTVVNLVDYGVFVELADGIEGLVHVSELTWKKNIKHPSKLVNVGDKVEAVILDLDKANRRISLGVKQLEKNPWIGLEEKYPPQTRVKGVVRNVTDFGIFVGIQGEEIDGLVHISDLSWDKSGTHPSEFFKKGQEVEAIVLSVDKSNERFALGIKQLSESPADALYKKWPIGSLITKKIKEMQPKGIVVDLDDEYQGYIANNDLSHTHAQEVREKLKVGDEITAQIKKIDEKDHKVILSVKIYEKNQEKKDIKEFLSKQGDASVKLKDAFKISEPKE